MSYWYKLSDCLLLSAPLPPGQIQEVFCIVTAYKDSYSKEERDRGMIGHDHIFFFRVSYMADLKSALV